MSRRHVLKPYRYWENIDPNSPPVSPTTDCEQLDYITYKITCQATVVCEIQIFVNTSDSSSTGFVALDFGEQIIVDGSVETEYFIQVRNTGFKYINMEPVTSSGTGTMNAWLSGNTVGA